MRAVADVMFSLLTSGFVLSPSLFFPWIQFVLSVQFVLRVRLLLDRSWLATVRDVSCGTHHVINPSRPSPRFSYCKQQKLGMEAWEQGYSIIVNINWRAKTRQAWEQGYTIVSFLDYHATCVQTDTPVQHLNFTGLNSDKFRKLWVIRKIISTKFFYTSCCEHATGATARQLYFRSEDGQ